jgi:xanthine dehydrogenase accessory factor
MPPDRTGTAAQLDAACLTAHGGGSERDTRGLLVAVFAGDVAHELLLMGARLDYSIALIEPDDGRRAEAAARIPRLVATSSVGEFDSIDAVSIDDTADVVMTDHHRDELGPLLRDLLSTDARWIGLMGSPRHVGPHVEALRGLGVDDAEIGRIHRPIGLNIGSRTPAEIAIATLAGLVAERAGRPGGFAFA